MTGWPDGALRSPVTLHPLSADTPHSLAAGTERWPVVDGIPFLRADRRQLADTALHALDAGDAETALVLLLGDQDGWARTPPPTEVSRRALVRGRGGASFRDAMDALALGPVAAYFAHRWSDPTFLSGLALAEAHWTNPAQVFELACGAGHYLREFARAAGDVTGADLVFAKLWLARHWVAPGARLVCFDAAVPWPLGDGSAELVFCHDALYFLPEKPHVAQEMRRVAGSGAVLVGHAHNALVDNLSAGEPLPPARYASLFQAHGIAPPLLYDDRELTAALVEARAPRPADVTALADAPAVCVASNAGQPRPVWGGLAMPPEGTTLRRNPLYRDGQVQWPSSRYEQEYASLATYPARSEAPETAVAGADTVPEAQIRRRELLDLPERW